MTTSASDSAVTFVTFTESFPHVSSTVQSNTESATPEHKDQPTNQPPTNTQIPFTTTSSSRTHMTVGHKEITNRVGNCCDVVYYNVMI